MSIASTNVQDKSAPRVGIFVGGPKVFWKRVESGGIFLINLVGSAAAVYWLFNYSLTWVEISCFVVFYCITTFGIGAGVHRLFAHKAFECGPVVRFFFGVAGMMACQGSILKWAANHRRHHANPDAPGDPHSPVVDGHGKPMGFFRGMHHAHLGFLFDDTMSDFSVYAKDLLRDPLVMFFHRTRWFWYMMSFFGFPALWGYLLGGPEHVVGTILVGGTLRVFLVLNNSGAIASFGHTYGSRRFDLPGDRSRNNVLLALVSFGEGWHNNHHRFPRNAYAGLAWYEIDLNGTLISLLEKLGLVRNVMRVPRSVIYEAQPAANPSKSGGKLSEAN